MNHTTTNDAMIKLRSHPIAHHLESQVVVIRLLRSQPLIDTPHTYIHWRYETNLKCYA